MTLPPSSTTMQTINRRFKGTMTNAFVPRILRSQGEVAELPLPSDTSSLPNTRDFIVNYPPFGCGQEDHDAVVLVMKLLSTHIIRGIAYDSSARTPHQRRPHIRLQLHERIIQWFYDRERRQSVLWLNAFSDIRTSVITQALAESLAISRNLGAALFLSRTHCRNNTQRVLITVAFQLAVRIPLYGAFVAEQITCNPGVLEGDIKEHFEMFITEPFGRRKIGEGEGPWGILLDGLDECESPDLQCEIVQLIGEFTLSFPHASLVWVITSQPQPYLGTVFTSEAMLPNHWSEYIHSGSDDDHSDSSDHSDDSDHNGSDERERRREERERQRERRREWRRERRREEECLLFTGFKSIRKRFSHLPSEWPSEIQTLKLANFVINYEVPSKTLVRFIADTDYADPISRLNQVLSIIESSNDMLTSDSHTAPSDALYAHILSFIPPDLWEATKQVLGFLLCVGASGRLRTSSAKAMSTTLGLKKGVISQSLHGLHSLLRTSKPPKSVRVFVTRSNPLRNRMVWAWPTHSSQLFLSWTFFEYLLDPARSQDNFVAYQYTNALTYYKIYLDTPWNSEWGEFVSRIKRQTPFYHDLRFVATECVYRLIKGLCGKHPGQDPLLDAQTRSECLDILSQINIIELYLTEWRAWHFSKYLFELWDEFSDELRSRELVKEVQLRDLTFDHLDCGRNKPVYVASHPRVVHSPSLPWTLRKFINGLQTLQRDSPTMRVLICGSVPESRNALFSQYRQYYCIPYPY